MGVHQRLSILSQLLRGRNMSDVEMVEIRVLSILSQLLHELDHAAAIVEECASFQFFPSCFRRLPRSWKGASGERSPFNSFPVASRTPTCGGTCRQTWTFQFFPSCFPLPAVTHAEDAVGLFQFFPSCFVEEAKQQGQNPLRLPFNSFPVASRNI